MFVETGGIQRETHRVRQNLKLFENEVSLRCGIESLCKNTEAMTVYHTVHGPLKRVHVLCHVEIESGSSRLDHTWVRICLFFRIELLTLNETTKIGVSHTEWSGSKRFFGVGIERESCPLKVRQCLIQRLRCDYSDSTSKYSKFVSYSPHT